MIELFGRYSGETSLITAYLASADRALIPEVPFDIDLLGGWWPKTGSRTPRDTPWSRSPREPRCRAER